VVILKIQFTKVISRKGGALGKVAELSFSSDSGARCCVALYRGMSCLQDWRSSNEE
jgi:hypothetical protein